MTEPSSIAPIDLVFTYVNGDDPAYLARRRQFALPSISPASPARPGYKDQPVRYLNVGEIAYSVRSVVKFLPWVRTIYIVTDSQVPPVSSELLESGRVRIVDHKEIIPDEYLPTFNSIVIESFLHRIKGLSEIFLCSSDDYMHFAPVPRSMFCREGSRGETVLNLYVNLALLRRLLQVISRVFPMNGHVANLHTIGVANAYALLRRCRYRIPAGKVVVPHHATHPARKSTTARLEVEFAAELDANRRNRFRSPDGFSYDTLLCTMEKVWNPANRVYRNVLWDSSGLFDMFDFTGLTVFGNTEKLWRRVASSRVQFACLNNIPVAERGRFVEVMAEKGLQ